MSENVKNVMAAIDYIESHLQENPDLETIAEAELLIEFGYPTQRFILQKSFYESAHPIQREEETEGVGHE